MNLKQQEARLEKAKNNPDAPDTQRLAIAGLQEIHELSCHPNSDPRIRRITQNLLADIANNLPE